MCLRVRQLWLILLYRFIEKETIRFLWGKSINRLPTILYLLKWWNTRSLFDEFALILKFLTVWIIAIRCWLWPLQSKGWLLWNAIIDTIIFIVLAKIFIIFLKRKTGQLWLLDWFAPRFLRLSQGDLLINKRPFWAFTWGEAIQFWLTTFWKRKLAALF